MTPSAATLHAAGIWHLVWSDRAEDSIDRAVDRLRQAQAIQPNSAAIVNDLAAAYTVRSRLRDTPLDLIRALELLDSTDLEPESTVDVRLNRLIVLERLHLTLAAGEFGREAALETSGSGSVPAGSGRKELLGNPSEGSERLAEADARQPSLAARTVIEDLLPAWAEASLAGELEEAEAKLRAARALAGSFEPEEGVVLAPAAVAAVDSAILGRDGLRLASLREGYAAFGQGVRSLREFDCDAAEAPFETAATRFGEAASPIALWVELNQSLCLYFVDPEAAGAVFARLYDRAEFVGSAILRAEAARMAGLSSFIRGLHGEAIRWYNASLQALEAAGLGEAVAPVRLLLAESLEVVGDSTGAWTQWLAALGETRSAPGTVLRHNLLFTTSNALRQNGHARAALRFADEGLANAELAARPGLVADALRTRARAMASLGRDAEAFDDFSRARRLAEDLPPGPVKNRLEADLERDLGSALVEVAPEKAVEKLSTALAQYLGTDHVEEVIRAYHDRARAFRALGRADEALDDLDLALAEVEARRASPMAEQQRIGFVEGVQEIFNEKIELLLERGQASMAWEHAQAMRAGSLVEHLDLGVSSGKPDWRSFVASLPAELTLLEYACLADRLVIWILAKDLLTVKVSGLPAAELEALIERWLTLIKTEAPVEVIEPVASQLYDVLVRPAADHLSSRLVVVPDGPLHRMPFAALFDREERSYLVEGHALSRTSTALTLASRRPLREGTAARSHLLVGNPVFDPENSMGLSRLPYAVPELSAIQELYPRARLLAGSSATRAALLESLASFEVVHLATHAQVDPANPDLSRLVLADESGEASVITAREIAQLDLSSVDLVVLATCQTLERWTRTGREGPSGLVRAFLTAGTSEVVGGLWLAEDRATAELAVSFHLSLASGGDASAALRKSQLAMLGSAERHRQHPSQWAGFVVVQG